MRTRRDIISHTFLNGFGLVAALAVAGSVAAQGLDATLDELVSDEIEQQVENEVTASVEQQVESSVTSSVEEQVESSVTGAVEQQVESSVSASVEQVVESGVAQSIEEQLDASLGEAVLGELEAGVIGSVEQQLDDTIGSVIEADLGGTLEDTLGATLEVGPGISVGLETGAEAATNGGSDAADSDDGEDERRFAAGVDALGRSVERNVWLILVPPEHAARIAGWGFDVQAREDLAALDRILVRVTAPEDRSVAQAALELALDAPGTFVDYNHIYTPQADTAAETEAPAAPVGVETSHTAPDGAGLAIGMVDSAVATHDAMLASHIEQRDFVPFSGPRPTAHGTAVASILLGDSAEFRGRLVGARLYAGGVFFEDEHGNSVATTESLVEALEWLVGTGVSVVNMSLAGPPNAVLEAAAERTAASGTVLVAAVGNHGPGGTPLYPAAYESVVGVTAVDEARRIYPYANRGAHVTFAAPGVAVRIARAAGGYERRSGTSMATPHAVADIALALAAESAVPSEILERLKRSAIDLGPVGFDETFGFGLIAPGRMTVQSAARKLTE